MSGTEEQPTATATATATARGAETSPAESGEKVAGAPAQQTETVPDDQPAADADGESVPAPADSGRDDRASSQLPDDLLMTEAELITDEMRREEEKAKAEEEKAYRRRLWELRNTQFEEEQRQQKQKRLKFLVERAGVYSKWLAEKLDARQKEIVAETVAEPADAATTKDAGAQPAETAAIKEEKKPARATAMAMVDPDPEPESARVTRRRSSRRSTGRGAPAEPAAPVEADGEAGTKKRKSGGRAAANEKIKRGRRGSFGLEVAGSSSSAAAPAPAIPKRTGRQPSLVTGCTMREYQLVGMEWLISLYDNGLNGILADEMGLGKTLQTLAFLAHLREMGTAGPFLIVAPLSTLANWVAEVERFTPTVPVVLYHGSQEERAHLRSHKLRFVDANYPLVVTSYEICMNDRKHLQSIMWRYIVVDEGHRIKNLNCRLVRELKSYNSANRLLLTGTPLQNNLSELWALLNFLMPDIFDDLESFEEWFEFANDLSSLNGIQDQEKLAEQENNTALVNSLHQILKPFLLRRIKSEVAVDLPKKREYLLYAPLTPKQKELYDSAIRGTLAATLAGNMMQSFGHPAAIVVDEPAAMNTDLKENDPPAADGPLGTSDMDKAGQQEQTDAAESGDRVPVRRTRSMRNKSRQSYTELSDDQYFQKLETAPLAKATPVSVSRTESALAHVTKLVNGQKLQNVIMQLRKVCNHPYLFDISQDEDFERDMPMKHLSPSLLGTASEDATVAAASTAVVHQKLPEIVAWSGKMLLLERLLPALFERGHKVLIFSQMTRMLDVIADWCFFVKKWQFCRIDGSVHMEERRRQIHDFNHDPDHRIFLLSTRAGGLGINLTAADTVIIFDSDWNPQADLQAQDRVHRIGQRRPVIIYRLVTSGSVERRILDKAQAKRKLEKLVIHKGHFKGSKGYYTSNKSTHVSELAEILMAEDTEQANVGLYKETIDGVPLPSSILSDEELDRILDRSPEAYQVRGGSESKDDKFRVVVEEGDESNDALVGMQDGSERTASAARVASADVDAGSQSAAMQA
ncbi:SNF2 family N-terminal domain-containing protein [Entophlyctis helioformis]|nr:SNF2 family N-terminal domain-containing protein [Entophlyctis helioformis]